MAAIKEAKKKAIVIDDSQYLLVNELFDRSFEKGYDKFVQMASNFRNLIHFINDLAEEDKIVYFLHHSESAGDGREKAKTIGRMLDEKLTLEGCFDIVLYCQDHKFFTQANGMSTAKSPEGMFELEIPNDLKAVDTAIRDYYGLNKTDATKAAAIAEILMGWREADDWTQKDAHYRRCIEAAWRSAESGQRVEVAI